MFRLQAEAKGIAFSFIHSERLPDVVYTDERRLRQILINLLSNAIKFTNAGEVHLGLRLRSEIAEFEIADTGIGIAETESRASSNRSSGWKAGRAGHPRHRPRSDNHPAADPDHGRRTDCHQQARGQPFRVRLMLSEAGSVLARAAGAPAARL